MINKQKKIKKMSNLKKLLIGESTYVKVEDKNRFYYMLQQMQSNRWKIIEENWKEMLLILLGAFVGNLNKVVDYWFNSEDRDKMLIQKVDEEDGTSLSNVAEYPTTPRPPQGPVVVVNHVKEETTVVEEPMTYTEPEVYEEPTQEGEENI